MPRIDARHSAALHHLVEQINDASAHGAALQIIGGNSKDFYGNPLGAESPGRPISPLSTRELQGITSYEPSELVISCLAGTPLAELEAALAAAGQCLPFEPPRFAEGGTVGGMVAAGLAGPARRYVGSVRDYVLGISLLNGKGELLHFGGQVMKNVAGYDVSRLMAGALGILGVLCELSLKVLPVSAATATLRFDCNEQEALRRMHDWATQPLPLSATCWHAGNLYLRLAGAQAAVHSACSRLFADGEQMAPAAATAWWQSLRDHQHPFLRADAQAADNTTLWRLSLPPTAPAIELPGTQLIEWGGAQRWWRTSTPAAQVRAIAAVAGGHATLFRSLEPHTQAVFAPLDPVLLGIHKNLKQAFDPARIFNPGRLYPEL